MRDPRGKPSQAVRPRVRAYTGSVPLGRHVRPAAPVTERGCNRLGIVSESWPSVFLLEHRLIVPALALTMTALGAALVAIYGVTLFSVAAIGGMAGMSWTLTRAILSQGQPSAPAARLMHDRP